MRLPAFKNIPRGQTQLRGFYGYEPLGDGAPGTFTDMLNLSSDRYPLLSVRKERAAFYRGVKGPGGAEYELYVSPDTPLTAAASVNGLAALCSETAVYYKGAAVTDAPLDPTAALRTVVPFGRNFFVVPDGAYVETDETGVTGVRHAAFTNAVIGAVLSYADGSGTAVSFHSAHADEPLDATEGYRWLDTSERPFLLKQYTSGVWEEQCRVYLLLSGTGVGRYAAAGDRLTMTLSGTVAFSCPVRVQSAQADSLLLIGAYEDYPNTEFIVTLQKKMPPLDLALEHKNRVWGCRFGANAAGDFVNEIYASAPGDPTEWDRVQGISTDSYTVSLGCPGAFTGAAVVGESVVFFKEDCVIRVTGDTPQDYTVQVTPARGVAAGHGASIVTLNEKVFYLSDNGVTVFDGALPYLISRGFSTQGFTDTLAFGYNGRYYLAANDGNARRIYVYDTRTGLWHVEDDAHNVRFFLRTGGVPYMLCKDPADGGYYRFYCMDAETFSSPYDPIAASGTPPVLKWIKEERQPWYALTGELLTDRGHSVLRGAVFRVEPAPGASFTVELQCPGSEKWVRLCRMSRMKAGVVSLPVNTPRCRSFRLRLSGTGGCVIHSVTLVWEKAGEVDGVEI